MISEHAIIDPSAKIAKDVEIGPWTIIGPDVEIGSGTKIMSHVVIKGPTKIGKENKIYQFASIGEDCQDKKFKGEISYLEIGDRNIIRENVTIHRGTKDGGYYTKIGNDNLLMIGVHIAHDCILGSNITIANLASIAGHVEIDDFATIGGLVGIHQFCKIGAYSLAAGGSIIYKDVSPYVIVAGHPAKATGLNLVGLKRNGLKSEVIKTLQKAYKIVFKSSKTVASAILELGEIAKLTPEAKLFSEFLEKSTRGIIRE